MKLQTRLTAGRMYRALLNREESFEGIFVVAVKTTGIFCRPTCRARNPKKENVEFFSTAKEALLRGYRPCRVCSPMIPKGEKPSWLKDLMAEIDREPTMRLGDSAIRRKGLDPNRVRRWFKRNHHMTFQAYLRSIRLGKGIGNLAVGDKVIDAAFANGYESLSGFSAAVKKLTGENPQRFKHREAIQICQVLTPLGPMVAGSVNEGICLLEFSDRRMLETQLRTLKKRLGIPLITSCGSHIKALQKQLNEYFEGRRKRFDLPLVTPGTPFQMRVWDRLKTIPYGECRTYKSQAKALGDPRAVRAIARANGDNQISIIIPCHRVIGSDGKLVGYGGGIWRKKYLLDLERKHASDHRT
ncbi:MAG: methylated-DNA--[protein]-cysteine S-methyltransferase [Acidobacteriota bacterium]